VRAFLSALFLAGILTAGASATTIGVGICGSFSNPYPNSTFSGSFVCPSAASLGITDVTSEYIVYDSDYSSGLTLTQSIETEWTFSGVTAAFSTDTTTSNGGSVSTPAVSSDGLTLNPLVNLPPMVLAGFYDTVTGLGTPTIGYQNMAVIGGALEATGYAEVVYVSNPVPEPATIPVVGGALLALCFYRRKKQVTA
jgi:hypothetical protein